MAYERHFIGDNAHQEALDSVAEWASPQQMMIMRQALAAGMPRDSFRVLCSFIGFSGYPVRAMMMEYHARYVRRFGPKSLNKDIKPTAYGARDFK